jgi:hypothetical protein
MLRKTVARSFLKRQVEEEVPLTEKLTAYRRIDLCPEELL